MSESDKSDPLYLMTRNTRYVWGGTLIFSAALLMIGALIIPFRFESSSMFYKFGADKILLRTGKLLGVSAAVLLLFQLPLAGRFSRLDRIYSLHGLFRFHRIDAFIIGLLAILHPVAVLVPDDRYLIPWEFKFWPEWVGVGLMLLIFCQVVSSGWRRFFSIPYHRWSKIHRLISLITGAALIVHVLYVSETFERPGIPRTALITAAGCWTMLWIWARVRSWKIGRRAYRVARITNTGKNAYAFDLVPGDSQSFSYVPGQYAFFSFASPRLSGEVHPFTLSSTPTRKENLQITVRCSGDWTGDIGTVREGDTVFIQGPYGRFTHLVEPSDRKILMIAGGIGITPMLSMLRYMSDTSDPRPVTLIWSNRSEAYLFGRRELEQLRHQLTGFTWIPIFTREKGDFGLFGRLDRNLLEKLLMGFRRDAAVFLCGPLEMTKQVRMTLKRLGFGRHSIKREVFGL